MKIMLEGFKTAKGEYLHKHELLEEIKDFIRSERGFSYRLLVGTDSEMVNSERTEFISVIAIHRIGRGGRFFWKKFLVNKPLALHERIWQEAIMSLNLSQEIIKELKDENLNFSFEVHLDIGTNGKSSSLLKEIISLVKSFGFVVKTKPESYAASKVADSLF